MDETYSMSAAEVLQVAKAAGVCVNVDEEWFADHDTAVAAARGD